eukprot:TRINITY_DN73506_c0_g1_i1.p1 TRINITY_DN73506_c0_g1~~TRINITY_DN73506_c0_g1_i1.p1  ORF type:complete len:271 (+),score=35.74 TRINITY_DN73506_c0_g1_i1:65-877(+)
MKSLFITSLLNTFAIGALTENELEAQIQQQNADIARATTELQQSQAVLGTPTQGNREYLHAQAERDLQNALARVEAASEAHRRLNPGLRDAEELLENAQALGETVSNLNDSETLTTDEVDSVTASLIEAEQQYEAARRAILASEARQEASEDRIRKQLLEAEEKMLQAQARILKENRELIERREKALGETNPTTQRTKKSATVAEDEGDTVLDLVNFINAGNPEESSENDSDQDSDPIYRKPVPGFSTAARIETRIMLISLIGLISTFSL